MKKILAVLITLMVLVGTLAPCVLAAEEAEFQLTIDVNERYTDISETVEGNDLFGYREKEQKEKETKRNTFIAILTVALVVAVIILVITLKRVPDEKNIKIGDSSGNPEDKKE